MDFRSMFEGNNLLHHFEMQLIEISDGKVIIEMPVTDKVRQPFGFLHGGATIALCETAASLGSASLIDPAEQLAFGLEINANHLSSVRDGIVRATAKVIHKGSTTHVWEILVHCDRKLICVSRATVAIQLKRKIV